MHNRFDQLGKTIGQEALGPSGTTVAHDEISPDAQHADLRHEPDPACETERARLGLLGRLAATLCLIEIFSGAPDEDQVLACIGKLIAFRQKRARDARRKKKQQQQAEPFVKPFLWIIAAKRPAAVLAEPGWTEAPGWPCGIYFGAGILRTCIVAAGELPRDRSTLLVRLMAAGPLLAQAIEDLGELPPDAHERAVAEQILLRLQHVLRKKPSRTPEEQEFIMTMHSTWEDARKLGLKEGRAEEAVRAVLTALRVRGLAVPDAARERILAETDPDRLQRWHERSIVAASIDDVLDEPS